MAFYYFSTSSMNPTTIRICLLLSLLVVGMASADQLSSDFNAKSCPKAVSTIQSAVNTAVSNEARMGASLLRLHFHDCFVDGCECDVSVLLDDIPKTFAREKITVANANSLSGFEAIDVIKSQLESLCPGVVSCADILVVAARDSNIIALRGPSWSSQAIPLGRRGLLAGTKPKYGAYKPSISHDQVPVSPSCPNPSTNLPGGGGGHCTEH